MEKTGISIGLIIVILLIGIFYAWSSTKIGLFEEVDKESITEINIAYIGGTFSTNDKSQILEFMDYLQSIKVSKRSDNKVPNATPDAQIALRDNNGNFHSVATYGDVARIYPKEEYVYTMPTSIYSNLEDLCKKYK